LVEAQKIQRHGNLLHSTTGLVFFGVPHRGSKYAQPLGLWQRLLRFITNSPQDRLLKILVEKSAILAEAAGDFGNQINNFQIATFFENRTTGPLKTRVRNKPEPSSVVSADMLSSRSSMRILPV
jgi:hypothetical protein